MKILIVEDDRSIAELERDYLALDGYDCDIAEDGVTGLRMALGHSYDLIILDIMLPGMDGFEVLKRIRAELVARVGSHIERYSRLTGVKRSNILRIRSLEIDRDEHVVRAGGNAVPLTAKEYDLLLFFAENPNRVFSREQLFERIWGEDSFGDLATVTVHVRRIREKIEPDAANPQYIETVWGAGYRFRA